MSAAGLDNPYATPRAPLEREEAPVERPPEMRWIASLAWTSFALDVLYSVLENAAELTSAAGIAAAAAIPCLSLVLTILLLQGRNWVRLLWLVSIALYLPSVLIPGVAEEMLGQSAPLLAIDGINLVLGLAVAVLLLRKPVRAYFRRLPRAARAE